MGLTVLICFYLPWWHHDSDRTVPVSDTRCCSSYRTMEQSQSEQHYALHSAIVSSNIEAIDQLLQKGEKPCFHLSYESCFLIKNDWQVILKLLQAEPGGVRAINHEGETLLSRNLKHLDRVKHLINLGCDPLQSTFIPNDMCVMYYTDDALKLACKRAPIEVLEYLLDVGTFSRQEASSSRGEYFGEVVSTGDIERVKLMLRAEFDSSHLTGYRSGRYLAKFPEILKLLHQNKPFQQEVLNSILRYAISEGDLTVTNLLLGYGADITNKPNLLIDSLENPKIVELLLTKGLNPNTNDFCDTTALMKAAQNGIVGTVRLLLQHGARISTRDREGCTALMHAVASPPIVKILLENGANMSQSDTHKETALIKAVGYPKSVKLLLEHGADVSAKDCEGDTALMKAVEFPESVELLLLHGASPWVRNIAGENALHLAIKLYEDPPRYPRGPIVTSKGITTLELLLNSATSENLQAAFTESIYLFYAYDQFYEDVPPELGRYDELFDEGDTVPGVPPPFLDMHVKKGFVARMAGIVEPKLLRTLLLKLQSNGVDLDPDPDALSPVTALLLGRIHMCPTAEDCTVENLKLFLNADVSLGQRLLTFCEEGLRNLSDNLQLNDCLALALLLGNTECLQLLLPSWSNPPLQLMCLVTPHLVDWLLDNVETWDCVAVFRCLASAGAPLTVDSEEFLQVQACLTTLTSHNQPSRYIPRSYSQYDGRNVKSPDLANKLCQLGAPANAADTILQEFLDLHQ